jgi:uncharacterized protein (DUF2147 family)
MILKEIKKGKKYFHTLATNNLDKATGLKLKETRKVFVLEVNNGDKKVCASINGAPAQWYDGNSFSRWTKKHPEENKYKPKVITPRKIK